MKSYILIILSVAIFSCSTTSDESTSATPKLTTKEIVRDNEGLLKAGGKVTDDGGSNISRVGVIWSMSPELSVEDHEDKEEVYSSNKDFDVTSKKIFAPNTTYYFRAFAQNDRGIALGNVVSYRYGNVIETLDPIDITTVGATLKGRYFQPSGNLAYAGFVYGTGPDPTILDGSVKEVGILGTMDYSIKLEGLARNTKYYIRSYTKIGQNYYYGEQKMIRTTGYFGQAGGIVAYDKGIISDGWRYLEISNKDVGRNYATPPFVRFGAAWCNSPTTYLAGTSEKMGEGPTNTDFIINRIAGESAARFCREYSANGYSDWFLPSRDEAVIILKSLSQGGMSLNSGLKTWSSSEVDAQQSFYVYHTGASASQKIGDNVTYPVRRY